jgi:hypothetical protein
LLIYSKHCIELWKSVSFHNVLNATFTKQPTSLVMQHVSFQSVRKWTKNKHRFFLFILPSRCHTLLILYRLVFLYFRQKGLQRPGSSIY